MRGSRNKFQGRGFRPGGQKAVWTAVFFFLFLVFLVLNLFYSLQRESNGFITEKTILFQGSRRGLTFSGEGFKLFPGGGGSKYQFL